MAIVKPTFGDIMAGAGYASGAVLGHLAVNEGLSNHRFARLRQFLNWRDVGYSAASTTAEKRVWYCGSNDAYDVERPQWVSCRQTAASPHQTITHRDFASHGVVAPSPMPNSDTIGGIMGCRYGTRQGLWSLCSSAGAGYWYTSTDLPITGAYHAVNVPGANIVHCSAYPGAWPNARMQFVDSAGTGAVSINDGTTWSSWVVSPAPSFQMCAQSLASWVQLGTTKIYRSVGTGTPVSVATNATLGIGTGRGVIYDSFRGVYHAWGSTGHAYSINDGVTWLLDTLTPLASADVRAFGCSDDGLLIAATTSYVTNHCDIWVSLDGANWSLVTHLPDPITPYAGCGRIEYGAGRFAIAGDNQIWISERVAL